MKYNAMDPQPVSRLDEAHESFDQVIDGMVKEYGPEDTSEAIVCGLIMSDQLDAENIRNRLDAHLMLAEAMRDEDEAEGNDWDELQPRDEFTGFAEDEGWHDD